MQRIIGINKQANLEVTETTFNRKRERVEIKYTVTNSSIEPLAELNVIERTVIIRNTPEQTDPDTGEVTVPAGTDLDEFNDQIVSAGNLETISEIAALSHAETIGIFMEFTDPTIDAWENETGTPEPANTVPWEPDVFVATGMKRSYDGEVYLVKQSHTTQADWTPDVTPALFKLMPQGSGSLPIWSLPTGAGDAYALGAQVKKGNKCYESAVANNVWMPGGPGIGDNIWFEITCP